MIRHSSTPRDHLSLGEPGSSMSKRFGRTQACFELPQSAQGGWQHPENCHPPVSYIALHPQERARARRTKKPGR